MADQPPRQSPDASSVTSEGSPPHQGKNPTPVDAIALIKSTSNLADSSDERESLSAPSIPALSRIPESPLKKAGKHPGRRPRHIPNDGMYWSGIDTSDQSGTQEPESSSIISENSLSRLVRSSTPDESSSMDITSHSPPSTSSHSNTPRQSGRSSKHEEHDPCCGVNWNNWFPNMCSCLHAGSSSSTTHSGGTSSYERLGSAPSTYEFGNLLNANQPSMPRCDTDSDRQQELYFFNDDQSFQTVIVEKNLRAIDLCQILALKNRVAKDRSWTIVESWPDLGLERSLEDHEDVLSIHRDMEFYAPSLAKRFVFRQDFRKYEFFHEPKQFFPEDMVDFNSSEFEGPFTDKHVAMQNLLTTVGKCPPIFSSAWIRDPGKNVWAKIYMVLRGSTLYASPKVHLVSRVIRQWRHSETSAGSSEGTPRRSPSKSSEGTPRRSPSKGADQLEVLAHLPDHHVYWTLNAKKQFRAPTEWGICLRPSANTEVKGTAGTEFRCITFENEKTRSCWIVTMRLAKYGKQLRENYRAFKNKQCEPTVSPKEYNSYTVPNESVRSRVAMDFTGSVGRIVEDPKEAKAIAVAEGTSWKRRWRPASRPPPDHHNLVRVQGLEAGVHITQPWFHSGMSRDQAANLVNKHGTVDGVFLVRESRSNPGAFVLTYKSGGKILHTQIQPIMDHVRETYCYSLDSGITKFYDLLQLVEFYQLNAGCLPTRLTHYVVQSPSGPILQEDTSTGSLSPGSSPGPRYSPSSTPRTPTPTVTPVKPSSF
ncbi:growth factor receptor-bound protein 14-like isoform X2 [Diprion similis]|uniref:growth factor receptor-bound protein 14-like isoform X2 n=1 Tax=Diprion similis TaxID=362088 RepID=UPI001EF85C95|nr:growth factor receptor-bound protein 14-like isoform X2 [Diprion similis]